MKIPWLFGVLLFLSLLLNVAIWFVCWELCSSIICTSLSSEILSCGSITTAAVRITAAAGAMLLAVVRACLASAAGKATGRAALGGGGVAVGNSAIGAGAIGSSAAGEGEGACAAAEGAGWAIW